MKIAVNRISVICALIAASAISSSPVYADQTFRICIGEYDYLCPTAKSAWFPCGVTQEVAAQSVCTIHSATGQTTKPFRILKVYDNPGNKCGYLGIDVVCLDQGQ
jgi:hypothetical protein